MGHFLVAVGTGIDDQAVAVFSDAFLCGDLAHRVEDRRGGCRIVLFSAVSIRDVPGGHDQDMGGRLGIDVAKGAYQVVAIDDIAGDVSSDDLAKYAIGHRKTPMRLKGWDEKRVNR